MGAAKQNLVIDQGSDYRRAIEFKNESNVLMDLTGYSFKGQARAKISDPIPAFEITFTIQDQAVNVGMAEMLIAATDTSALTLSSKKSEFIYDIEMIKPNGDTVRIIEGSVTISPEVTR